MADEHTGSKPDDFTYTRAELEKRGANYKVPAVRFIGGGDDLELQEHVPGESIPLAKLGFAGEERPEALTRFLRSWDSEGKAIIHAIRKPMFPSDGCVEEGLSHTMSDSGKMEYWPYAVDKDGNIWE